MSTEVRLEDLLGRRIMAPDGRPVGRIEELVAERNGDSLVVTRYLIGVRGLLRRLSFEMWRPHGGGLGPSYAAKWNQVDISDPEHPRLTCSIDEIDRLPSSSAEIGPDS